MPVYSSLVFNLNEFSYLLPPFFPCFSLLPKVMFITALLYLLCYSEEDYLIFSLTSLPAVLKTMGKHSLGPSGTSPVTFSASRDQSCDIQCIMWPVVWHSVHHMTSCVTFSALCDQSCDIQCIMRPVVWHSVHYANSRYWHFTFATHQVNLVL